MPIGQVRVSANDVSCESILEGAYLETCAIEPGWGDHFRAALEDASKCLAGKTPSCDISQVRLQYAITLRGENADQLRRAMTFEKDGVPIYNAVNLAELERGLAMLYVKLINNCKYQDFVDVAEVLKASYSTKKDGELTLKTIDGEWSNFEKLEKFRDAQAHIRYLKGEDVYAARLLIIAGKPLNLVKELFPAGK